jgi:23S rRNA (cytidine1920-2'-O)/16S rRNA (cytidine1409-2'-O)-methyltransferase
MQGNGSFFLMAKVRIDQLLVEKGLAESRQKAQALVMAGHVFVSEQKVDKPGRTVDSESSVRVRASLPFASRAGTKLRAALDHFQIPVKGRICADLGASTGGFTDCLLKYGARVVHSFDVGKGQLAWSLRSDPRVVVHDEFNVRFIGANDLPDGISLISADLSFISLTKIVLPLRNALLAKCGSGKADQAPFQVDIVLLVKPQFEVGKGDVGKRGIVRDPIRRRKSLESVREFAESIGLKSVGSIPSPLPGASGNQEFLLYLVWKPDIAGAPGPLL